MAGFRDREKRLFPIKSIQDVVSLCKLHLEKGDQPNLALLSILLGAIENLLTCNRSPTQVAELTDKSPDSNSTFPALELSIVEALYSKFTTQIKGSVDLRNKLDSFGVAYAVVAACQVLGFKDVHLALSEDHAWVTFGKDGGETAEVTWHGKGNEDKRGEPITLEVEEKSWLYLNGQPVKCTRALEVAALVSGINPSINATTDSLELATLQQQLLWILHDLGHLEKYPMALGNLGDLEELCPTSQRPNCSILFHEAIKSARLHYNDQHVYPYTYLGGYQYRNKFYKEALETWANAATAIRNYNYSREDEEIYKEFLEIANELIPNIIKLASSRDIKPLPLLQDPEGFAHLLRFYDGICRWEEGSSTPVLHIGWAKHLVNSISKFESDVRSRVEIIVEDELEVKKGKNDPVQEAKDKQKAKDVEKEKIKGKIKTTEKEKLKVKDKNIEKENCTKKTNGEFKTPQKEKKKEHNSYQTDSFIKSLETQINPNEAPHPNIAALAAACGENILNPEYLLGSGEPFSSSRSSSSSSIADCRDFLSSRSNGTSFPGMTMDSMLKAESPNEMLKESNVTTGNGTTVPAEENKKPRPTARVVLTSEKMKGLKELLLAEKLNASAIQLQLSAQSQVQIVKKPRSFREMDFVGCTRSTKRSRRE
uniref:Menin n=1 Tax=Strigamia maritima TaxID=126957 RepID=T1J5T3_STRMM